MGRSVRGEAILLCVRPGGGSWRSNVRARRIAAGGLLAEACLRQVITVDGNRLTRGPVPGEGALGALAGQVVSELKPRKIFEWSRGLEPWALDAVVQELSVAGIATAASSRLLGVVPQAGLDILDRQAQDEAAQAVRDIVAGSGNPSHEAALVALLLGAAGDLKYQVPGAAWPLLSFWSTRPRSHVRRRLRQLREGLPDGPREVIRVYEKYSKQAQRYDSAG